MKKESYTGSPELLKSLPRGAVMQIAKKRGVTYPFIYQIAKGRANTCDVTILQELYKLALLKGEIIAEMQSHFDDFLGMNEASKLTGVTPDTMRKYIKDGKIKNYTQSIGRPRLSRNECIELQKKLMKNRRI